MAPNTIINGFEFIPNNFVALLTRDPSLPMFHVFQDYFVRSGIGYAMTVNSNDVSSSAVSAIWSTGEYNEEMKTITFSLDGSTHIISLGVVRDALRLPIAAQYTSPVSDEVLRSWFVNIGYFKELGSLGRVKKALFRKEWSFFLDTLSKVFAPKQTNFDVLPSYVQQMGYALVHNLNFDFADFILSNIGTCINMDRRKIYYSRFLNVIFNFLIPSHRFETDSLVRVPQIGKRSLIEISKYDNKRQLREIQYPESVLLAIGARPQGIEGSQPVVNPSSTSQTLIPYGSSQKLPVVRTKKSLTTPVQKRRRLLIDESSESEPNVEQRPTPSNQTQS